ncbi:error-prone DNA polymerase [Pseudorhodoferax soli]|uniref:Error-prone DNA polymerase n=1 Tax=Pseudorhodoferax soli TaxID=545864 RepID=A0A368XP09_9BURK|nr:error-prone DNA polymerase [Pseudorhodoferax soli]RCW69289.1 DNA polymerase III alpha subunit [Pseudorhodoferax soli]
MPDPSHNAQEKQEERDAWKWPLPPPLPEGADPLCAYAELHALSNFSFQRGASHPAELVVQAYRLGYSGLALTDECSVAGVVRAHMALKDYEAMLEEAEKAHPGQTYRRPFRFLPGSEFALPGCRLVVLPHDLAGWGQLCELISHARRHADVDKGDYRVDWDDDWPALAHCEILCVPQRHPAPDTLVLRTHVRRLRGWFGERLWLAAELVGEADDVLWLQQLRQLAALTGTPLVAAGGVLMHVRSRKRLQDVLTAVRLKTPVAECGFALEPNAERRLRPRVTLGQVYPAELLANTAVVLARCRFDLGEISYRYPRETLPEGLSPTEALRQLTYAEAARLRYPDGMPEKIRGLVEKELALIAFCKYEMFFLTVHDIVRFARSQGILCQGRGSAANSVVCYCLGITAADPEDSHPLMERFISKERQKEPPDIDVDFEHERREEVIQYIYGKYGQDRAAIAAVVISYRRRSAIRDVGTALGIPAVLVDAFAKEHHWFDATLIGERLERLLDELQIAIDPRRVLQWLELTEQLRGFPRHLSQHVGGFVLTEGKLTQLVPIEKATMEKRSVIQWDKDDLDRMGLMKVDVLALGMLTALKRCLDFVNTLRGRRWDLAGIPTQDKKTYDMICQADTVGVFQIESRAQMSMLPRLKPRVFYDLVVEVAIVRPGPIEGGMVHPYLKARAMRDRDEPIHYEKPALEDALERTLGVPIFQEQVMQLAVIAAGFSPGEADRLRRSMAAWKKDGDITPWHQRLVDGMLGNGYSAEFAERIYKQVCGFGEYGFPESHAYSFALLAYASSWLKCHEPAAFLAALLNSQPMGFYPPSQLVQDAVRHGIDVRAADVSHSDWDAALEDAPGVRAQPAAQGQPAVRLGLRLVKGFNEKAAQRIMQARAAGPFADVEDLSLRAALDRRELDVLAAADALQSLAGHRRQQAWEAAARHRAPALLRGAPVHEAQLALLPAREGEEILFDYDATGLTLRRHPLALLRERLSRWRILNAEQLNALPHGRRVRACGLVTVRQQPGTAKETIFVTLEDETGPVNVIVWKRVREQQREPLLKARLLAVEGLWQRDVDSGGQVRHLVAERLRDLTPLLGRLGQLRSRSRDFH